MLSTTEGTQHLIGVFIPLNQSAAFNNTYLSPDHPKESTFKWVAIERDQAKIPAIEEFHLVCHPKNAMYFRSCFFTSRTSIGLYAFIKWLYAHKQQSQDFLEMLKYVKKTTSNVQT